MDVGLYGDLSARFSKVDKEDVPDQRSSEALLSSKVSPRSEKVLKGGDWSSGRALPSPVQSGAPGWKRGINQNKLRNAKREDGGRG